MSVPITTISWQFDKQADIVKALKPKSYALKAHSAILHFIHLFFSHETTRH